jgi:repressor LexA
LYERLTDRQRRIVSTIRDARMSGRGCTYREIAEALNIGLATVARELETLEEMEVVRRGKGVSRSLDLVSESAPKSIPLVGQIAAGAPVLADERIEWRFAVDPELVGSGPLFMLRVVGDSMVDAGILDGDLVVVRQQESAEDGDIVAALLSDAGEAEATVKRLSRSGDRIQLLPENPAYSPIDGAYAKILGKVVTLIRKTF